MRYPTKDDNYNLNDWCDNFHEIDDRLRGIENKRAITYDEYGVVCDGTEVCVLEVEKDVYVGDKITLTRKSSGYIRYTRVDGSFGTIIAPSVKTFEFTVEEDAVTYQIKGFEVIIPQKRYVADLKEEVDELSKLSEDKADKADTYTKAEVDEIVQNIPSGGGETWRTIREFEISNEEGITNDNSGITWTVDDSGNITAFLIETDSNGNPFSSNKLRYAIYPSDVNNGKIFGGKKGYLSVSCNGYGSSIYNATNTGAGYRIESLIEGDMSGILRQVTYMGIDRNSYANERPHLNFFNSAGKGYLTPPITRLRIACDTDIWFVSGAKVLVQICEEVS